MAHDIGFSFRMPVLAMTGLAVAGALVVSGVAIPAAGAKPPPRTGSDVSEPRQIAQQRVKPRPRWRRPAPRHLRRRTPLSYLPVCSTGFRVVRRYTGPGGGAYTCVSNVGFVCAPPYAKTLHGVGHTGGDGESYPYYRCSRQHPANHIGAVKCAGGFFAQPANAHPQSHASYRCVLQGLEPKCATGTTYIQLKKTAGGWTYRCG